MLLTPYSKPNEHYEVPGYHSGYQASDCETNLRSVTADGETKDSHS